MGEHKDHIDKYLKGELTAAQMHALEKEALKDPFLAEALEGAAQINATDFSNDVIGLNERITQKKTTWKWPMRIAATLLLLAVSTFIIWIALRQETEPQHLTLEPAASNPDNTPKSEPLHADSLTKESNPASKNKITSPQPEPRSKKSSPKRIKIEPTPELTPTLADTRKHDPANKPIAQKRLNEKQDVVTIDPGKKNELIPPSANNIKIAEGYIAAIDAQPTIVSGRVLSAEDGTPLPDVNVVIKGTSVMTKTDESGRYSIASPSKQKTLVYSSEGLESTEVKIEGIDSTYLPVKLVSTEEAQREAAVEANRMADYAPMNISTIPAHPETGNRAFKQYLIKNHKYPKEAKATQVEGTVVIEFKVDATGALSEFRIVRGIGNGCDEEVIRLILQGVKWVPTTQDGIPVSDKVRVRFKFELEK